MVGEQSDEPMGASESERPAIGGPKAPSLGAVIAAFAAGLVLAAGLGGIAYMLTESLAIGALVLELGFLVGAVGTLAVTHQGVWTALRLKPVSNAVYGPALALGFAMLLVNFAATILLGPPIRDMELVISAETTVERIILAASVGLLAPLIEEALFRGLLQGALERRLRYPIAIGITGLAFGLLHGTDAGLLFFFWSLPVGWITWRTGSIRPAVVVHAVNNVVGLVGLLASGGTEPSSLGDVGVATGFAVVLLTASALWAVALCRRIGAIAGNDRS